MPERRPVQHRLRALVLEAHRRSLWQVVALYGVISWMGYEVILGLTEGVGLPLWVPPFAVALFIIGLPVVVATAFVQEPPPSSATGTAGATGAAGTAAANAGAGATRPTDTAPRAAPAPEPPDGADGERRDGGGSGSGDRAETARRPVLTWRRVTIAGLLTFAAFGLGVSGFMGMRVMGIGPAGTLVARGELVERQPLVVADFEGMTGDASLAAVVSEGLRADLAQSSFVTTADRARVREALDLMLRPSDARLDAATAREVAIRLGLKAVVEGEVGRAGPGYLLTARVVTADSARTLAAFSETAPDSTALLEAIERLSRSLRERVGESLRSVRASSPLEQVTTASLPALRKAVEAWREQDASNRPRALRLMHQAVELDPAFASAWAGLAVMYYNQGNRDATLRSIREALAHEDRLDERQRHRTRGLHATIIGDLGTALEEQEEVAALEPASARAFVNLSDLAWNMGRWDDAAAHARRAIALDSTRWVAHWNLVVALLDGGHLRDARRAAQRAEATLTGAPDIARQLGDLVLASEARYDSVHARNVDVPARAALADRARGRWEEAERHAREDGAPNQGRWFHALDRLVVMGDPAAGDALAAMIDSIAADPSVPERVLGETALALAMGGRAEDARRARDLYDRRVPEEVRWSDAFLFLAADAFAALHDGRTADALADLRTARESTTWPAPVDALLGRAYDALGRPDSAIAAYARYVDAPWSYHLGFFNAFADPLLLAPAHERLAYLYDESGNPAAAARHAAAALELWGGADPVLRPRVTAIRRILERSAEEDGRTVARTGEG